MKNINIKSGIPIGLFKPIFKHLPSPIYIWEKMEKNLILKEYNYAAEFEMKGKVKLYLGIKATELYKDEPEILKELNKCIEYKEFISQEVRYKFNATGDQKLLDVNYLFMPPNFVIVHTEDITIKNEAELKLKKSEEQYRVIINNIKDYIAEFDLDGTLLYVNPSVYDILGYEPEELIGKKQLAYVHPEDLPKIAEEMRSGLKSGYLKSVEYRLLHKDGHYVPVYSNGSLVEISNKMRAIISVRDITELKKADQILKDSEKKFRYLFEKSPIGVCISNANGNMVDANESYIEIFGIASTEDVKQINIFKDLNLLPDSKERLKNGETIRYEGSFNFDLIKDMKLFKTSKSGISYLNTIISPLFLEDNTFPSHYIGHVQDITKRKIAKEKLKDQKATLESIFKAAPIGIGVVINRVITQVNDRFCDLVGYSREELLGKSARIVYPTDEDFNYVGRVKYKKIQNQGFGTVETRFKRKDGKIIDILLSSSPISPNDLLRGVTFTALDITERKKAERSLTESREKYRLLTENINDLVSVINISGCIKYTNEKIHEKVMGFSFKDLENRNIYELIHPEDREKILRNFNDTFKNGEGFVEARILHKDGYYVWTETNGKTFQDSDGSIKILTITRDITERKIAEEELKKNERFLQNIFDGMQDGISILDRDLIIIRVNYWMQEMYAHEGGLIGKKCYEIYQRREAPCPWCPSIKTLDSGQTHSSIVPYPSEENPTRWMELTSFPLKQQDNEIIGVIEYVKDFTERVIANQKLTESEEMYRNAYNRSNLYKDVFTHDINNILQNILSSLELINIFSSDPKRRQSFEEVSNLIYEQVIRGKRLVSNVQELSKTDDIASSLFSVGALKILNNSLESVKSQFPRKTVIFKINTPQDEYFVRANELLKDIFVNILSNAVQHNTNPFVEVLINVSQEKYNGTSFVKFEFLDNGIGIPDSMKQLIFTREYKKEGIPSGIGLGLLLVKKILEFYTGEVRVEDRIKGDFTQGSNFIITIPEVM